jgi:hypothetical protein
MEKCLGTFLYHDGLNHFDRLEWVDAEYYSGWVVVQCNCKLTNAALLKDGKDGYANSANPFVRLSDMSVTSTNAGLSVLPVLQGD